MANLQENICAICDATIDIDIVMDHDCYKDYNQIHVDDAGYVYPKLDDGMIVDPINETQDESLTEVLRNEMLIGEIQKREPLWNFKIPISERGRTVVQKLWEEIVSAMDGNIKNINEAKSIWKKLRYNYSRIVTRENDAKKSGSAGNNMKKKKWPYYEMMAFTRDLFVDNRKRSSNIPSQRVPSTTYNDETCSIASTSSSSSAPEKEKRKRRSTESNEAMLMKLTAMLDAPVPELPELVLPPLPAMPPQNDEIENVIGLVRASLNRIPLLKRQKCILELLTFLYSLEDSYK